VSATASRGHAPGRAKPRHQFEDGLTENRAAAPRILPRISIPDSAQHKSALVHERGIEPRIPVFDKSQHTDGTFSRDDFTYEHERNCYICPAGKEPRQRQKIYRIPRPLVDEDGMMRYRASKLDCQSCSLKPQCCPNTPARKIPRSIHEGARDMARDIATTESYRTSRCHRKRSRCCSPTSNAF
jgi:hypothetical protein